MVETPDYEANDVDASQLIARPGQELFLCYYASLQCWGGRHVTTAVGTTSRRTRCVWPSANISQRVPRGATEGPTAERRRSRPTASFRASARPGSSTIDGALVGHSGPAGGRPARSSTLPSRCISRPQPEWGNGPAEIGPEPHGTGS